jgi:hypothetical protein
MKNDVMRNRMKNAVRTMTVRIMSDVRVEDVSGPDIEFTNADHTIRQSRQMQRKPEGRWKN